MNDQALLTCPYCAATLKKVPQRKTKCPTCREPIYIKYTPDDRNKRLMTQAQADAAEALWKTRGERQHALSMLKPFAISEADLDAEAARYPGSDALRSALVNLLNEVTFKSESFHERQMAHGQLAAEMRRAGKDFMRHSKAAVYYELLEYQGLQGYTAAKILRPEPWAPSLKIAALHRDGVDEQEIAKRVGYSRITVRNCIAQSEKGKQWPANCSAEDERTYSFAEALSEMPLPCGPDCQCSWWPITKWDRPEQTQAFGVFGREDEPKHKPWWKRWLS